ncbi:MAG: TIGR04076 family protein [Anaerolineae bacterium]|nr:TIGR04076 family protein [Anaerolineae bacterium]
MEEHKRYRCKITVIRKLFHEDLYEQYPYSIPGSCGRFEVGQEFITASPWDPPDGFCAWAWADLRPMIHAKHAGDPITMISCCTDGLRPVLFRLELVED